MPLNVIPVEVEKLIDEMGVPVNVASCLMTAETMGII